MNTGPGQKVNLKTQNDTFSTKGSISPTAHASCLYIDYILRQYICSIHSLCSRRRPQLRQAEGRV